MSRPGSLGADAGLTLVEALVALALFAVISLAGLSMLDGVLRVRERTDGRLERLADLQRGLFILTTDLEQASPASLAVTDGALALRRTTVAGVSGAIRYAVRNGALTRTLEGAAAQNLLPGVAEVRWRFFVAGQGWRPEIPIGPGTIDLRPRAVAVDLILQPDRGAPSEIVTRLIELPRQPRVDP